MEFIKKHWVTVALGIILLVSFVLMAFSAASDSLTVDEKVHISAGYTHTWKGDYRFNPEHPPLLNDLAGLFAKIAKPNMPADPLENFVSNEQWVFGDKFFYFSGNNLDKILFWGRFPFILLTLGLVYLCFIWARELFGPKAGIVAALLAAFCPNILAHGRLATTDIGLAFSFLLAAWFIRKYSLKPSLANALGVGGGIFLTVMSKFSGILIVGIAVVGIIYALVIKRPRLKSFIGQAVLIIVLPLVLSWLLYAFTMRSEIKSQISSLSLTGSARVARIVEAPIEKFRLGYDMVAEHNDVGHYSYLNGKVSAQGWRYYFLMALLYKLTLSSIILFAVSLVIFIKSKSKSVIAQVHGKDYSAYRANFIEEFWLWFPAVAFLGFSLTSKINIGIRHILPFLPFLYIFISRVTLVKSKVFQGAVGLLLAGHIVASLMIFPNYLSFFNVIAGGPSNGDKHLADSNIDWNQNIKRFAEYAKENNIKDIQVFCWDFASFEHYGLKVKWIDKNRPGEVVVACSQQLRLPYGVDTSWFTKYLPDDVFGHTLYIWRFDQKHVK